jgi:putative addiction module component (TIGR02574 family)
MASETLAYKALPPSDRLALIGDIWDSLVEDAPATIGYTAEDLAEFQRRSAAHDRAPHEAVGWAEVKAAALQGRS